MCYKKCLKPDAKLWVTMNVCTAWETKVFRRKAPGLWLLRHTHTHLHTHTHTHTQNLQLFVLTFSGLSLSLSPSLSYCCDKASVIISIWNQPRLSWPLSVSCHGESVKMYRADRRWLSVCVCVCVFERKRQTQRKTEMESGGGMTRKQIRDRMLPLFVCESYNHTCVCLLLCKEIIKWIIGNWTIVMIIFILVFV